MLFVGSLVHSSFRDDHGISLAISNIQKSFAGHSSRRKKNGELELG